MIISSQAVVLEGAMPSAEHKPFKPRPAPFGKCVNFLHSKLIQQSNGYKIPKQAFNSLQEHSPRQAACKNSTRMFVKNLEEYLSSSSMHGLRYAGDPSVTFVERLFWICAFTCAVAFAVYFIHSLFTRFNESPVLISINPVMENVMSIPFPAITICSTNQAKKSEAELILKFGNPEERLLLNDYCNFNMSFENIDTINDETTNWQSLQKFLLRVNPTIDETLKVCLWRQREIVCDDLFNYALTDDGLCYSFNALSKKIVFRDSMSMALLNLTFPPEREDWNPERGYSQGASVNALPQRVLGAGSQLGLTVVLDANIKSYFCSSVASVGFKILLHNPLETPNMADFAMLAPPGIEARFVILPKIFDADPALRDINIPKRKCYFVHEKQLIFYRTYTEVNCKLECQANFTLASCGCVPFFLPKNKDTQICTKGKDECVSIAKGKMEIGTKTSTYCDCLPACFQVSYEALATYGELSDSFKVTQQIIKSQSPEYFMKNMAVIHFYFSQSEFTRHTKSVIYGFSEFLSNTGGILGLFLGFSFLSVVEIAYYLSLRIGCKYVRSRKEKRIANRKKRPELSVVYQSSF